MLDGFLRVCAVTPKVKVADPKTNAEYIIETIREAAFQGARVIVFPELCITGYTCGDLFYQDLLLDESTKALRRIADATEDLEAIVFVGLPLRFEGKLLNVAAGISRGKVLGFVPKANLPNYDEYYEKRHFVEGEEEVSEISWYNRSYPIGRSLLFACEEFPDICIGAELCEDLWTPAPPSVAAAMAGATILVNLSASDDMIGKRGYRRQLVNGQAARLYGVYIYANAGMGESTQDVVYSGHSMISECGQMLAESRPFSEGAIYADVDLGTVLARRRRMNTYRKGEVYEKVYFKLAPERLALRRIVDPMPFVPGDKARRRERCEEILGIQSYGLRKRLEHTGAKNAVVGISGGLDSTLALLVTVRAFDLLELDRAGIIAITMPGFGTTERTRSNAVELVETLGCTLREIPISESVRIHFRDIGHDEEVRDVTYENSQARERTQILMDVANKEGGLVIGTGDLSELALGWATYNGDHMSMYGVNASVPKTLVRHLVRFYADEFAGEDGKLSRILLDILDTPVSPELLPPKDGEIQQKTEDLVGPYELHDFFLYYMMRFGFTPSKIFRLCMHAFAGRYQEETVKKWMRTFYRRFFAQQFKRSCLPDGPKVGSVALSPRGDFRMPSDACARIWLDEVESL